MLASELDGFGHEMVSVFFGIKISIFESYTEFQDGRQILQDNNFWQKVPDDCIHPVGQKNFPGLG